MTKKSVNIFKGSLNLSPPAWEKKLKEFSPSVRLVLEKAKIQHDMRLIRQLGKTYARSWLEANGTGNLTEMTNSFLGQLKSDTLDERIIPVFADFIRCRLREDETGGESA